MRLRFDDTFTLRWAIVLMLFTTFPFLVGYLATKPGYHFLGYSLFHSADQSQYFSYILQAEEGHLIFENRFTTEPLHPFFVHPLFLVLGWLVRLTGIPAIIWYHLCRLIILYLVVRELYRFSKKLFASRDQAQLAVIICTTSSGAGWLSLSVLKKYNPLNISLDFHQVEAVTFKPLYSYPLHALGFLLIWYIFMQCQRAVTTSSTKFAMLAGFCCLLLILVHPYDSLVPATIAPILLLLMKGHDSLSLKKRVGFIFSFFSICLWGFLYYLVLLKADPIIGEWVKQVPMPTRSLWYYLPGYGFLVPLALIGLSVRGIRWNEEILLWLWPLCVVILLQLPLSFQNRLINGVHIPISLLSTAGLIILTDKGANWIRGKFTTKLTSLSLHKMKKTVLIVVVVFLAFSNILIVMEDMVNFVQNDEAVFISPDFHRVLQYLKKHSENRDIVLAPITRGNLIPAISGNRVYLGHEFMTIDSYHKAALIRQFFDRSVSDVWRRDFLVKHNIAFVLHDQTTANYGSYNPESSDFLKKVLHTNTITLFKTSIEGKLRK